MKILTVSILFCGILFLSQTVFAQQKIATVAQVNGTWQSKSGTFKILALGGQKLQLEFFGEYKYKLADGTWTANEGELSGVTAIENRTAVFKPAQVDDDCLITLEFAGSSLNVKQKGFCGFGYNVTAAGRYRKTSARKPKFAD